MSTVVESVFSIPTRVYWEDTDAGGVVYHAQYVAFLERARTDWLRSLGYGQELLRDVHGVLFAIRSVRVDFRKPARLDDMLEVTVELRQLRRASALFVQEIRRGDDLLVSAEVRAGSLGAGDFRPCPIPAVIYEVLKSHQTTDAG